MKKRYSKWLEEKVYDMEPKHEKLLEELGYEIIKPELVSHDDGITRDIPHYIGRGTKKRVNISFDIRTGEFKMFIRDRTYNLKDIDMLIEEISNAKTTIEILRKL